MRISDWSSDVCSSDLAAGVPVFVDPLANLPSDFDHIGASLENAARLHAAGVDVAFTQSGDASHNARSEEHTSELQSLMRISYAVFRLKRQIQALLDIEGNTTHDTPLHHTNDTHPHDM